MNRLHLPTVVFMTLLLAVASETQPLRAFTPNPLPEARENGAPETVESARPAPLRLAFLSDTGPSRRHMELPLSESEATLRVPNQIRLLLFSPHPDDETLAAAGLVQRVIERGGSVRVVWMTNGDGFLDGVRSEFDVTEPTDHDFIEYGKMRQKEATSAIGELGLKEGDSVFLGFPDGGLYPIWEAHWSLSHPYTSPHTRLSRSTYPNSYRRAVQYSGTALLEQIMGVMRDFSPDWVLLPDPRDHHPDHAASGAFILDALRKLREAGEPPFSETEAFTYLVHFPAYPNAEGWVSAANRASAGGVLTGSQSLAATQWLTLPIDSAELQGKRRALARHDSQMEPLGPFLNLFLVRYEVFGRLRPSQIMEVPVEYAARFRKPNS
ncbi:MAG: PIG-L family deacetylase [Syntrophobacteraceae bacterium]|nr:PIG-L family deacetylase [Syntrophobacteraceae bacterium]